MSNIFVVILICLILEVQAKSGWGTWSDCEASDNCFRRRQFKCVEGKGEDCLSVARGAFEQIALRDCNTTIDCLEEVDKYFLPATERTLECSGECSRAIEERERVCSSNSNCLLRLYYPCYDKSACADGCTGTCTGEWVRYGTGLCSAFCDGGNRTVQYSCGKQNVQSNTCVGSSHAAGRLRMEYENCNTEPCPVWTGWNPLSGVQCSVTCGEGTIEERSNCVLADETPVTTCNGTNNSTYRARIVACNTSTCPQCNEETCFTTDTDYSKTLPSTLEIIMPTTAIETTNSETTRSETTAIETTNSETTTKSMEIMLTTTTTTPLDTILTETTLKETTATQMKTIQSAILPKATTKTTLTTTAEKIKKVTTLPETTEKTPTTKTTMETTLSETTQTKVSTSTKTLPTATTPAETSTKETTAKPKTNLVVTITNGIALRTTLITTLPTKTTSTATIPAETMLNKTAESTLRETLATAPTETMPTTSPKEETLTELTVTTKTILKTTTQMTSMEVAKTATEKATAETSKMTSSLLYESYFLAILVLSALLLFIIVAAAAYLLHRRQKNSGSSTKLGKSDRMEQQQSTVTGNEEFQTLSLDNQSATNNEQEKLFDNESVQIVKEDDYSTLNQKHSNKTDDSVAEINERPETAETYAVVNKSRRKKKLDAMETISSHNDGNYSSTSTATLPEESPNNAQQQNHFHNTLLPQEKLESAYVVDGASSSTAGNLMFSSRNQNAPNMDDNDYHGNPE